MCQWISSKRTYDIQISPIFSDKISLQSPQEPLQSSSSKKDFWMCPSEGIIYRSLLCHFLWGVYFGCPILSEQWSDFFFLHKWVNMWNNCRIFYCCYLRKNLVETCRFGQTSSYYAFLACFQAADQLVNIKIDAATMFILLICPCYESQDLFYRSFKYLYV